jgi:hypothetical protein
MLTRRSWAPAGLTLTRRTDESRRAAERERVAKRAAETYGSVSKMLPSGRVCTNRDAPKRVMLLVIIARRVMGVVLFFTGVVWVGQGTSVIMGSSMTGSTFWAVMGGLCIVGGLGLLGWPWRQTRSVPNDLR